MIIYFTVTNDLRYDQRMIRIATSLAENGYKVTLVGRKLNTSIPLLEKPFRQKRLRCFFTKGKLFYAEYNTRLFIYLLFKKMNCICAIDLDTILPCYFISILKKIPRVYDAHELFCEMKEIISRPNIYAQWKKIEKFSVPKFINGYTVNKPIADEFYKMYKVSYGVIRNVPVMKELMAQEKKSRFILYQGAVNEGRSLETIIPSMKMVNAPLIICGDGNFMKKAKAIVAENQLNNKVEFTGYVPPDQLRNYTLSAYIGVNLVDDKGMNSQYSLANRFFDFMHAGLPQVCVDLPGYRSINEQFEIALLISDLSPESIAAAINELLSNEGKYLQMQKNCMVARQLFNWQNEEKILIKFYKDLIG